MRVFLVFAIFSVVVVSPAFTQMPTDKSEIQAGVGAYKQALYDDAARHFEKAISLNNRNQLAHLYLATILAQQYIPGAETPDNLYFANGAIAEYKQVLKLVPSSVESMKGIASLSLQMKKFGQATEYYKQAIAATPDDPELYYSIGVIDWTQSYEHRMKVRGDLKLKMEEPLIQRTECYELRNENESMVNDGIQMMTKAIELRRDYDDAMAYMNLMYRERADIQCGDEAAYHQDLKIADQWVSMTMDTKQAKAARHSVPQGDHQ